MAWCDKEEEEEWGAEEDEEEKDWETGRREQGLGASGWWALTNESGQP